MANPRGTELSEPVEKRRFDKQEAQTWIDRGMLYVTFHRYKKPKIPFPPLHPERQEPIPIREMVNKVDWIRRGYEYIAFIPTAIPFGDPLLLGLWFDEPHMPIEEWKVNITTFYRLEKLWVAHWTDVEAMIIRSVQALL